MGDTSDTVTPSPKAWHRFWDKLDGLGVWKWRTRYWNDEICDGTQWKVDIVYGEKRLRCSGSNRYPLKDGSPSDEPTKTFEGFQKAVEELCGIKRP